MHRKKRKTPLHRLEKSMSQFLDSFRAALERVANGNAADQATKDAVKKLQADLLANETSDAEFKTAITELVNKLADAPAPVDA